MRRLERMEKTITVLCQEGGRISKKILQDYLHKMIGSDR